MLEYLSFLIIVYQSTGYTVIHQKVYLGYILSFEAGDQPCFPQVSFTGLKSNLSEVLAEVGKELYREKPKPEVCCWYNVAVDPKTKS